jgi:hypothetical protein
MPRLPTMSDRDKDAEVLALHHQPTLTSMDVRFGTHNVIHGLATRLSALLERVRIRSQSRKDSHMTTYEELTAWAGAGNVTRADPAVVSGWRIPEEQKALLVDVGVPVVDELIEYVSFQVEAAPVLQTAAGGLLYRLTQNHHGDLVPGLHWSFGVQRDTGTVYYVLPEGEAWFANSSIDLWLRTLHHYGLHVSESEILNDPDDREDEALAELSMLADELKKIDPPAFGGYIGFIWAEFLDRWLW